MESWQLLVWLEGVWLDGSWGDVDTPPDENARYIQIIAGPSKQFAIRVK